MKTFIQHIKESMLDVKTLTSKQVAEKHKVPLKIINQQLKQGIEVEYEHTTDYNVAKEIALDHLSEKPDYYTKLKKVENS